MPSCNPISFTQPLKNVLISRQTRGRPAPPVSKPKPEEEIEAMRDKMKAEQEKAVAEAFRKGVAKGREDAVEEARKQFEPLEKEVQSVLRNLEAEREHLSTELEGILPELIIEGVGRVLYNLEPDGETIRQIVLDILEGFDTEDSQLRLVLHPKDLEALKAVDKTIEETYPGLRFIGKENLHRGECYLEGRFGLADARYSAKLSSLRKVLE